MGKKAKDTQLNKINITPSESVTKAKDIANTLNTHFTEIGPRLASKIPSPPYNKSFTDYLTKVDSVFSFDKILPTQVLTFLKTSDVKKAIGVDKISNKILKIAAPHIYQSLTNLFNLSLKTSHVPKDWKTAKVTPIFKTSDRCDANNYRPISIISTAALIFEKVIFYQ